MKEKEVLLKVFHVDGSLRDIYVNEPTTIDDWNAVWKFINNYNVILTVDGEKANELPSDIKDIFKERKDKSISLIIDYNGIDFACHFFTEEEIEFDINPADIKSEVQIMTVFKFMESISKLLLKDVSIADENEREIPLVTVNQHEKLWFIIEVLLK